MENENIVCHYFRKIFFPVWVFVIACIVDNLVQ